jgi:hypothetical protein
MKNSATQVTQLSVFKSFEIENANTIKGKGDGEIIIAEDMQEN